MTYSPEEFAKRLVDRLVTLFDWPMGEKPTYAIPSVGILQVDCTGGHAFVHEQLRKVPVAAEASAQLQRLEVTGRPIWYRGAPVTFELYADEVEPVITASRDPKRLFDLKSARSGMLTIRLATSDLQKIARAEAIVIGKQHGITIKDLQLGLTSMSDRDAGITVTITASKFGISSTITINGNVAVNDALEIVLRDVHVAGNGMLGTMAGKLIEPRLKAYENEPFPLADFTYAGLSLTDVALAVGPNVQVQGVVGSMQ